MNAILCRQLCKRYENQKRVVDAVRDLDLCVQQGQCFGLLGPNGAGKTTTVEIMEGLLEPTSGGVEVLGMKWHTGQDQQLRQRIGITLQDTRFPDKLSALEVLALFRNFYVRGISPEEALDLVGLREKASAWVRELSGGQRQRLAVATALVGKPDLLFLDEPTTGLDPQARRKLWEVVSELRARGTTVLLTTHYMDEAEKLCDQIAIVDRGQVIAEGSPRELVARLGGEHVIEFSLEIEPEEGVDLAELSETCPVSRSVRESGGYLLTVRHPHIAVPSLLRYLEMRRLSLKSLNTRHVNLEDVFVTLTGRHLRNE